MIIIIFIIYLYPNIIIMNNFYNLETNNYYNSENISINKPAHPGNFIFIAFIIYIISKFIVFL